MAKKVNIYYAGFVHRVGGAYYHVINIKRGLNELGYEVNIITLDSLPIVLKFLPHIVEKVINKVNSPLGFLYKQKLIKYLYKFYFRNSADIDIFEDIYTYWKSNTKSVVILHALWSDNLQAFKISEKKRVRLEDEETKIINQINTNILTVSEPYKNFILSRLKNLKNKKLDVVELGVDLSKFKSNINNNKSIIYVGALEERKNIKLLLEVYLHLKKDTEYSLTIVGDGPQRKELDDFIEKQKIKEVNFLGRLNYIEVIDELKKHQYYMHTSTKESFSYSLLEAKLSGLTTIAYKKLEVPSSFIDIKVESFDIQEWVERIQYHNKIKNNEIKVFNKNNFSYQKMTSKTLDYINGMMS